jgi:hypothetical protein
LYSYVQLFFIQGVFSTHYSNNQTATTENHTSHKEGSPVRRQFLVGLSREFFSFHKLYHKYFQRHTVNIADKVLQYLKGLFQAGKKNMERMEKRVAETVYDPLHVHFRFKVGLVPFE